MTWLAVRSFLTGIPRAAWIALAVALALFLGVRWYHGQIKAAEKRGSDTAYAAVEKKALELKAKSDAIADKIRSKSDETARAIAADADVIRVSGPGKARCSAPPAASGRRETPSGKPDAARPEVPATDSAAVPWQWLVQRAEQCDLNRNEVLSWREWYEKLEAQR